MQPQAGMQNPYGQAAFQAQSALQAQMAAANQQPQQPGFGMQQTNYGGQPGFGMQQTNYGGQPSPFAPSQPLGQPQQPMNQGFNQPQQAMGSGPMGGKGGGGGGGGGLF
jgi:hypothetical protein